VTVHSIDYLRGAANERTRMQARIKRLLPQAYNMHSLANVIVQLCDWLAERSENSASLEVRSKINTRLAQK
jgi:hypothetical protein